jgi:membrane peptidoglycan carboxypeptidase
MDKKPPVSPPTSSSQGQIPDEDPSGESLDILQQAVRYKAFKHTFAQQDVQELSDRRIVKKLKKSRKLEEGYYKYQTLLENNRWNTFFRSKPFRRLLPAHFRFPRFDKWLLLIFGPLLVLNYLPGPTQHIVEMMLARAIYDAAPIKRLPQSLESYAPSARILDMQGSVIKSYGKRRVTQEIPARTKMALLACEDHYFLAHPKNPWYVNAFLIHAGVSWFNLAGALKDNLAGQKRGGSTIVMQNAKKILGNTERTFAQKLEEMVISYRMVSHFGKEKNLDFYINTVPVGANIYGFPAAAHYYFRKDLEDLNLQQLVVIGSFIPNHFRQVGFYEIMRGKELDELSESLRQHVAAAMAKTNSALTRLRKLEEISEAAYRNWLLSDAESIRRIGFREFDSPLYGKEEWTTWNVIRDVCSRSYLIDGRIVSGSQLLLDEPGDVVIETGIDLALVENIKKIIADFLNSKEYQQVLRTQNQASWRQDLELYQSRGRNPPYKDFEGFMEHLNREINMGVVIINQQGEIVAYVGGKEFGEAGGGENGAAGGQRAGHNHIIDLMNRQARLSPSSTIKPVTAYYAMLTANASLETTFADQPLELKYVESAGKEVWLPRNWYEYDEPGRGSNRFRGRKYSLLEAQVLSVNTIFAQLYTNRALRSAMLGGFDDIGLEYDREDAKYWPFGIGATSLPVQQWLGVYNAFLDGYYREPAFVKRILVNDRVLYDHRADAERQPVLLFSARPEREAQMYAMYEIANRGTAANLRTEFKHGRNLVSGKTGTAPESRSSLFISHFNPYRDRAAKTNHNLTMMVAVTTNTGGHKSVGSSSQAPTLIAGRIYNYLYANEFRKMMDRNLERARRENPHFRNNHVFLANINRYMEQLLNQKCGNGFIHENIIGIDGYEEALQQLLNSSNRIYTGRDDLFRQLVDYYCSQTRLVNTGL